MLRRRDRTVSVLQSHAEIEKRRNKAKRLRLEAETVVAAAKARVEQMILGEEGVE